MKQIINQLSLTYSHLLTQSPTRLLFTILQYSCRFILIRYVILYGLPVHLSLRFSHTSQPNRRFLATNLPKLVLAKEFTPTEMTLHCTLQSSYRYHLQCLLSQAIPRILHLPSLFVIQLSNK